MIASTKAKWLARGKEVELGSSPVCLMWLFLVLLVPFMHSCVKAEEESSSTNELATAKLWSILDKRHQLLGGVKFSELTEFGVYGSFDRSTCTDTDDAKWQECHDSSESCEHFARRGECMHRYLQCPRSCLLCQSSEKFEIGEKQGIPIDIDEEVRQAAETLNITVNDIDQSIDDLVSKTASVIQKTQKYMSSTVMEEKKYLKVRRSCQNYDRYCSAYAAIGYCEDNFLQGIDYTYMMTHCAPACQKCDDYELLQPCSPNQDFNIVEEGYLDRMFRQIVGEGDVKKDKLPFRPTIHSRPGGGDGNVIDGPWIVTLVNFLSDSESEHLITLGREQGYRLSGMLEEENSEEYRTSVNSWCTGECADDLVAKEVIGRISRTTGIPTDYSEPLQMLQYMPGQRYKEHHDVDHDSFDLPNGPRILTFFLYLNDVREGGATRMVDLKYGGDSDEDEDASYTPVPLTIFPRKGMALVWANLNDEDLTTKEERTWHEALPVIRGIKYGANAWFRIRRFVDDCNTTAFETWKLEHRLHQA